MSNTYRLDLQSLALSAAALVTALAYVAAVLAPAAAIA